MMRLFSWLVFGWLVCGLAACTASSRSEPSVANPTGAARPPDFELETLDGQVARLSDHWGKDVVLLDFWATYCDPCLAAMPHLNALYREHRARGFVIFGISIDGPESSAQVRSQVAKLAIDFPILLDDESRVVALYNPKTSAPYSVLIGRDGQILARQEGYTTSNAARLEADVSKALEHPRAQGGEP